MQAWAEGPLHFAARSAGTVRNAVGNEFPRGEKLCGVVLDLIVNNNNWKNNPYLYACILGTNANVQCQRDTPFLMSMELLLYTCVNMVAANAQLLEKCRVVFRNRSCTCSLAWKLHRYDIGSDGLSLIHI